jgi:hypothetical protein
MLVDKYRAPDNLVSGKVSEQAANCDSNCEFDIMA